MIVATAVMSTLGGAAGGTSLLVAHLNVRGPIDATTAFLEALDVGSQDDATALSCQEGGGSDEAEARIEELRLLLEKERWDGEAHLLGTDLRPFDLSADTATVTGALSVYSLTGASRDFRGTIVDLGKERDRWKVCDLRVV